MRDALTVFYVSIGFFVLAGIPAWLAMSSARTRIGRARRAAEALADDVEVLLEKGEVGRARELAEAHDTAFAEGLRRALKVAPSRRADLVRELGEEWQRSIWSGGSLGYGCFVTLVGGIAALYTYFLLMVAIGFGNLHGLEKLVTILAGLGAGLMGFLLLRRILRRVDSPRHELASFCHQRLVRVVAILDASPDPPTRP